MKLLKSAVIATTVALSLGSFSTTAVAVCLGMACMYNHGTPLENINATVAKVAETLKIVKTRTSSGLASGDKESDELIINNIKEALKLTKEINANDKVDRNRNRANDSLKNARTAVKAGDLAKATVLLAEAETRFEELKGMLDLTQADRVSQQTNLLNRIMDTEDKAAGAR
ncbi:MAG: hypothetical protein HOP02_08790 [Methylococcaceae bacterium]|nr:hypothetical protein [Methylococcaceae bacterium]